MFFVLQKEIRKNMDIDVYAFMQVLEKHRYMHEYTYMSLDEMKSTAGFLGSDKAVPVGTIEFVQAYLKQIHGIKKMNPIEIPEVLRKPEYLHREYRIIKASELPKDGNWFIKDGSRLKGFSYAGNIQNAGITYDNDTGMDDYFKIHVKEDQTIVLSSLINIRSEYRAIVINNEIKAVQYYDGDCLAMLSQEQAERLKQMVHMYSWSEECPRAYTMDIAITKENVLAVIECHPFVSVGLYGYYADDLPYAYRNGLDWYLECNKELY